MSDRTRGTLIDQLDPQALTAFIQKESGIENARPTYEYGFGIDTEGNIALICSEGVGDYPDADGKFTLSLSITSPKDADGGYTVGWREATVDIADLITLPSTKVDLADFIRVFGARLESNFYIWQGALA
jgi:hypothetical protein